MERNETEGIWGFMSLGEEPRLLAVLGSSAKWPGKTAIFLAGFVESIQTPGTYYYDGIL